MESFKLSQNEQTFDHSVRGKANGSQEVYRGLRNKHEQGEDNKENDENDPEHVGVIGKDAKPDRRNSANDVTESRGGEFTETSHFLYISQTEYFCFILLSL